MTNRDSVPGLAGLLRAARLKAGLTQRAAAQASGVHVMNISKFETAKATPTLRVLYRLAAAYRVDVCDLLPRARKR